jgi:ATP/maltotriose-dependent transcriptional regulator MalT
MMLLKGEIKQAKALVEEAHEIARDSDRSLALRDLIQSIFGYLALIGGDFQRAENLFEDILTAKAMPESSLGLTFASCGLGDYAAATQNLQDALQTSPPYLNPMMKILCAPAAAFILSNQGEAERAVELLALANHHPASPAELVQRWPQIQNLRTTLETELSTEVFATAYERGQGLNISAVLAALSDRFGVQDRGVEKDVLYPIGAIGSLIEPLSERELEILRLLKTDLSGPEIARELVISLNTVRFHTKNIYFKLQVNNRRAAVRRADELGL